MPKPASFPSNIPANNFFHKGNKAMSDKLIIAGREFRSRLILGSGKYETFETMVKALEVSGTDRVTVAVRRVNLQDRSQKSFLDYIDTKKYHILPNTAGCYSAEEAVRTAMLAREALDTNWVKLEVIGDERTLFPDNEGLLEATKRLWKSGVIAGRQMAAQIQWLWSPGLGRPHSVHRWRGRTAGSPTRRRWGCRGCRPVACRR